jgi:hypothetical protein
MSALLWILAGLLAPSLQRTGATLERWVALCTLIGAGVLAYALAALGLGAVKMRQLLPWLRRAAPAPDA